MKKRIFGLFSSVGILMLSNCQKQSQINCNSTSVKEHSMAEVKEREIEWKEIFLMPEKKYYVYCYGPNCPHCLNIKNEVIEFALINKATYFCKILNGFEYFSDFNEETIGISKLDYLTIKGTPSLLGIENKKVYLNISGEQDVKSVAENEINVCK